jgi:hypothetical protein
MQAPFAHASAHDKFGPKNLPPSAWHSDGVMFSRQFPAVSQLPLEMQQVPSTRLNTYAEPESAPLSSLNPAPMTATSPETDAEWPNSSPAAPSEASHLADSLRIYPDALCEANAASAKTTPETAF